MRMRTSVYVDICVCLYVYIYVYVYIRYTIHNYYPYLCIYIPVDIDMVSILRSAPESPGPRKAAEQSAAQAMVAARRLLGT